MSTQKVSGSQRVIELIAVVAAIAISWHVVAKLDFADNIALAIAFTLPSLAKSLSAAAAARKRNQDSGQIG